MKEELTIRQKKKKQNTLVKAARSCGASRTPASLFGGCASVALSSRPPGPSFWLRANRREKDTTEISQLPKNYSLKPNRRSSLLKR